MGAGQLLSQAIMNLPIVATLRSVFSSVQSFLAGNITFFEAGKNMLMAFGEGIWSSVTYPYQMLKKGLDKLRALLPFSDAKEGPLSALTASGSALLETLASGMQQAQGMPVKIFSSAVQGIKSTLSNVWGSVKDGATGMMAGLPSLNFKNEQENQGVNSSVVTPNLATAALNLLPKLDGKLLPTAFSAALVLQPVLAGAVPQLSQVEIQSPTTVVESQTLSPKLPAMVSVALPQMNSQSETTSGSAAIERQIPQPTLNQQQTEKLAIVHQGQNSAPSNPDNEPGLRDLLATLITKFDSLAERPIAVSVATNIDGRQIAEAVYKDIREQKIRNYETL